MVRRLAVPAVALTAALVFAGCSGNSSTGGMPTPADDNGSSRTTSDPTPTPSDSGASPSPSTSAKPVKRAQVVVVPGRFAGNPAVRGLTARYPLFFQALVQRDSDIIKNNFPAFFYADTALNISDARSKGWIMRPPGSVVVVGVEPQPLGVVRVKTCRSQRTQYWDLKARKWTVVTPKGSPDVIDMIERGDGWTMYRWVRPIPKPYSCATVRYPF